MPDIVISEFMDEAVMAALTADYDVLYDPDLVEARASLEQAVRTTPALIVRNRTQVRGPLLETATHLKVIGRLSVGLDNIDLATCEQRGIEVVLESNVRVSLMVATGVRRVLARG